jgi:hypothetical protein
MIGLVNYAVEFMVAGACFECIVIVVGYAIFSVFRFLQGGDSYV